MWKRIRDKYRRIIRRHDAKITKYAINNLLMLFRNTVMKAMQVFDPDGVAVRSKRKLQRREYFSKV